MLEAIPASRLPYEWLAERCDLPRVLDRLHSGEAAAFRVGKDAALIASISTTKDSGVMALWVEDLGGDVGFRPHENARLITDTIERLSAIASRNGCKELRIECNGRRGWKDAILPRLGFKISHLQTGDCMIKDIENG